MSRLTYARKGAWRDPESEPRGEHEGEKIQAREKYNFKEESVLQEFQKEAAHRGEREKDVSARA